MPYILSHAEWVARQVERVKGVLAQNMIDAQEYSGAELLTLLADYGLDYSNPEYTEIGAALLAEGFLETT